MTLLLGRIEALERALRAGHSSATHDTPSVTILAMVLGACRTPTMISVLQELLELLIHQQPDWTSQHWIALFTSILEKV